MSLASRKLIQATAGAAGAGDTVDDDFANVVLLLDGDGTSGDDNNTFTDSSPNSYTVTKNGDVVQGSFSPYGDNWSVYFEDETAFMQSDTGIDVSTDNFTIEMWVWTTRTDVRFCAQNNTGGTNFYFGTNSAGKLRWDVPTGTDVVSADYVMPLNQWVHVAAVREGTGSNQFKMYADGVLVAESTDSSTHGSRKINIAGGRGNSNNYDGYISNFRFVVGSAVYTSAFTPPTEPLTNITNTKLLACQSNRFIDNSATNDTFTLDLDTGLPKVTPFSPFKDDDARDITTDGGSAYFDDSTSTYLSLTNITTPRTDSFTIEFWAYFLDAGASGLFQFTSNLASPASNHRPGIHVDASGNLKVYGYGTNTDTGVDIVPNQWYHIALSRNINTLKTFVNGEITNNATDSEDFNYNDLLIGKLYTAQDMNGYISDFRYIKGNALYTQAFTPPTAPLNKAGEAYSIAGASYTTTISVATQDTAPRDVFFKPDGTKMYVVGAAFGNIYQYSLSTAWDVSTATYDSKSLSTSSEETTPTGMFFKPDGTSIIIVGSGNNYAFQYDLTTAWDVSTGSYSSKSFDLSTQTSTTNGVALKPDGTKMFVVDDGSNNVFQYSLSTGWDISTASYDSVSASVSEASNPMALEFNADGTKMYIADRSLDRLFEYSLSTAWSLSSVTHIATFKVNAYELNPSGVRFGDSGTKLYTSGYSGDAIDQYSVFSDPDLLLNFHDAGIYDLSGINNIDTVGNAQIDTAVTKYGTGSLEFDGTGDYLETVNNSDVNFGSGAFTIESWVYRDATPSGGIEPVISGNTTTDSGNDTFSFHISTSRYFQFGNGTTYTTSDTIFPLNQWVHLAVSYDGTTLKMFQDGSEVASAARSYSFDFERFKISRTRSNSRESDQYLDDLRVTKGIARYTSSFTPPTAELPKF